MPSTKWSNTLWYLSSFEQRQVHAVPLDSIADRAFEPRGSELALDQVVLRSRMHHFEGNELIVRVADNDDGKLRRLRFDQGDVAQPGAIRHADIQQHRIETALLQRRQAGAQVRRRPHFSREITGLTQHLAHITGEPGVMLNQQKPQYLLRHR